MVSRLDIALDCNSEAKLFEFFGDDLPHTVRLWSREPTQDRKTVVPVQTNILCLQLLTKLGNNERSNQLADLSSVRAAHRDIKEVLFVLFCVISYLLHMLQIRPRNLLSASALSFSYTGWRWEGILVSRDGKHSFTDGSKKAKVAQDCQCCWTCWRH